MTSTAGEKGCARFFPGWLLPKEVEPLSPEDNKRYQRARDIRDTMFDLRFHSDCSMFTRQLKNLVNVSVDDLQGWVKQQNLDATKGSSGQKIWERKLPDYDPGIPGATVDSVVERLIYHTDGYSEYQLVYLKRSDVNGYWMDSFTATFDPSKKSYQRLLCVNYQQSYWKEKEGLRVGESTSYSAEYTFVDGKIATGRSPAY